MITSIVTQKCSQGVLLDVGAHGSTYLDSICKSGFNVVSLELNRIWLRLIWKRLRTYANFYPICADAQYLPFREKSLDCIVCGEVIEHLPKPRLLLRGAHHSLKKATTLIITTPNVVGLVELSGRLLSKFKKLTWRQKWKLKDTRPFHINCFTYGTLLETLLQEGFKVEDVKSQGLGVHTILKRILRLVSYDSLIFTISLKMELKLCEKLFKQLQRGWIITCTKLRCA